MVGGALIQYFIKNWDNVIKQNDPYLSNIFSTEMKGNKLVPTAQAQKTFDSIVNGVNSMLRRQLRRRGVDPEQVLGRIGAAGGGAAEKAAAAADKRRAAKQLEEAIDTIMGSLLHKIILKGGNII